MELLRALLDQRRHSLTETSGWCSSHYYGLKITQGSYICQPSGPKI